MIIPRSGDPFFAGRVRSGVWRCEPGDGVLKHVKVGSQDKAMRWRGMRARSRRFMNNAG